MTYVTKDELAAATGAALVGFKQTGAAAVPVSADTEFKVRVRPEQFGAAADGVTDDAPAINAAIAAVAAQGGGNVCLAAKMYAVGQPILMQSRVTLQGEGAQATVIKQIGTIFGWAAITNLTGIITTSATAEHVAVHVVGLSVHGLYGTPIPDGAASYAKNGISLGNLSSSSVVDCHVRDTGTGIVMFGSVAGVVDYHNLISRCVVRNARSWNAAGNAGTPRGITMATNRSTVSDCVADDCRTGYYVATDFGTYRNCRTSRWTDNGFYVNANHCGFTDCFAIASNSRATGSGSGFAVNPSTGHTFAGCVAMRCPNAGIRFRHDGALAPSGNRVIGCHFSDCGYGFLDDMTGANAYPDAVARNNVFIGNMAEGCQLNGFLFIRQQGSVIIGNTALNNNRAGVGVGTRGGIGLAEYCLNNVVASNVCDDTQAVKRQTYGLYSYPKSVSAASIENLGNRIEHRSIFGVDEFFPAVREGTQDVTINTGSKTVLAAVSFPTPFDSAPVVTINVQNGNALADGERPVSAAPFNITASGFSFLVDTVAPVAANRLIKIGWRASRS